MRAVLLLLALAAVALAATPTHPWWPSAFSASVLANDNLGDFRFFRWFYSQALNKDRVDGPAMWNGEQYWATSILDYTADVQYDVFYQQDLAVCFTHAINTTMPKPDLTALNYIGKAVIGQEPVYHWYIQVPAQNVTFQYYDDQTSREPVRMDFAYGTTQAGTWNFMEFDDEPQDASLYSLPSALLAQCTPVAAVFKN